MTKITYIGNDNKKHIGWIKILQRKTGVEIKLVHHDRESWNILCFLEKAKLRR